LSLLWLSKFQSLPLNPKKKNWKRKKDEKYVIFKWVVLRKAPKRR